MSRRVVLRSPREEDDLIKVQQRIIDAFRNTDFKYQQPFDFGSIFKSNVVVSRDVLGWAELILVEYLPLAPSIDADRALEEIDTFLQTSSGRAQQFDQHWIITRSVYSAGEKAFGPRKGVRVFALEELESLLAKSRSRGQSRARQSKARSKIGKAIESSEKEIQIAIAALALQIEAKIEVLRDQRPNSPDSVAERDAHISDYQRMREELDRIRDGVAAFAAGKEKEAMVVKSVTTFRDGLQNWWHKGHEQIIGKTFDSALFLSSVGLLSLMKADMKTGMVVAGSLIAGRSIVSAMKKIPKKLPWSVG